MRVQVFVPSPSATPQCLPKRIAVHLYKVKTPYVYATSVRDLVSRPNRLWDFHELHCANSPHKAVKQRFRENRSVTLTPD